MLELVPTSLLMLLPNAELYYHSQICVHISLVYWGDPILHTYQTLNAETYNNYFRLESIKHPFALPTRRVVFPSSMFTQLLDYKTNIGDFVAWPWTGTQRACPRLAGLAKWNHATMRLVGNLNKSFHRSLQAERTGYERYQLPSYVTSFFTCLFTVFFSFLVKNWVSGSNHDSSQQLNHFILFFSRGCLSCNYCQSYLGVIWVNRLWTPPNRIPLKLKLLIIKPALLLLRNWSTCAFGKKV